VLDPAVILSTSSYVPNALWLSAFGIYIHAITIAIAIGFSVLMAILEFIGLWKKDPDYLRMAKLLSRVLVVAFGFGAATGTLVEFGLVQVWNGVLIAIASVAFMPLYLELVAFILEGALLVALLYTWNKFSNPWVHWIITVGYATGALLSGVFITSVNAWMQVPWGVGDLVKTIYPWAPVYGPTVLNPEFLLTLKEALVTNYVGGATGSILVNPIVIDDLVSKYGTLLTDPLIALKNPYALPSVSHQLIATTLVGVSWVLAGVSYKALKDPSTRVFYMKMFKTISVIAALLLILQGLEGHEMGVAVFNYQPTKFAMIAGLETSGPDPVVGLTMFGDPNYVFDGFDKLLVMAQNHPNPDLTIAGISVKEIAVADTLKALEKLPIVFPLYTAKISIAVLSGLIALMFLSTLILKGFWEGREKFLLYGGILYGVLMPTIAGLGWAVREVGRKPWTVYGLLYPEELITPVEINSPVAIGIILGVIIGISLMFYTIYIVLTKPPRILGGGDE